MACLVEDVLKVPDVWQTCFLWQIQDIQGEDDSAESWEAEEAAENFRCLPSHWQTILNGKLAEFHSSIQDAEALYQSRKDRFGDSDIKTKNAFKKLELMQGGEGAKSVVLISKATLKEASPGVYNKSVSKNKGVTKVACSNRVQAYEVNIKNMTLQALDQTETAEPPPARQLRIVSVRGLAQDTQEIRVHLNSLSLCTSHVMDDVPKPKSGKSETTGQSQEGAAEPGAQEPCPEGPCNCLVGSQFYAYIYIYVHTHTVYIYFAPKQLVPLFIYIYIFFVCHLTERLASWNSMCACLSTHGWL